LMAATADHKVVVTLPGFYLYGDAAPTAENCGSTVQPTFVMGVSNSGSNNAKLTFTMTDTNATGVVVPGALCTITTAVGTVANPVAAVAGPYGKILLDYPGTENDSTDKPFETAVDINYPACIGLPAPIHGSMGTCNSTQAHGSSCSPTCNTGYTKSSSTASCSAGMFTPITCAGDPCPGITAPANGTMGTCNSTQVHGSSCSPTCNTHYTKSSSTASCSAGTFTPITCLADPCANITAPANGGVGTCASQQAHGSTCSPTCNTGYTKSSSTASCSAGTFAAITCKAAPTLTPTPAESTWTQTVYTTACTTSHFNNPGHSCKPVMMQAYCTSMDICSGTAPTYVTGVSLSASAARRNIQITFIVTVSTSGAVTAAAILATAASLTPAKLASAVNAASLAITGSSYNTSAVDFAISHGVAAGPVWPQESDSSSGWLLIVIIVCSAVGGLCLIGILVYVSCTCCKSTADAKTPRRERRRETKRSNREAEKVPEEQPGRACPASHRVCC